MLHYFGFRIIETVVYYEATARPTPSDPPQTRPVGIKEILYNCKRVNESQAVYKKDGRIRRWQDADYFELIFDANYNLLEVRK